jgi:hypothetical protein
MPHRLAPVLLALALLAAGCADARSTAETVRDCASLASDVARTGLSGVPSREQAEAAVRRLDERIPELDSQDVRDAVTELRDRLREVLEAAGSGDAAAARQAAEQARAAAGEVADTCGLPVDQFVTG